MIFQWEFYLYKYNDLQINGLLYEEDAYQHWINYGKKELRIFCDIPILFDWRKYLEYNDDLKNILNEDDAWKHYLYFGCKERRMIQHSSYLRIYGIK
jgi:hypothetical protein